MEDNHPWSKFQAYDGTAWRPCRVFELSNTSLHLVEAGQHWNSHWILQFGEISSWESQGLLLEHQQHLGPVWMILKLSGHEVINHTFTGDSFVLWVCSLEPMIYLGNIICTERNRKTQGNHCVCCRINNSTSHNPYPTNINDSSESLTCNHVQTVLLFPSWRSLGHSDRWQLQGGNTSIFLWYKQLPSCEGMFESAYLTSSEFESL